MNVSKEEPTKQHYVSPSIQIKEIEFEHSIAAGSTVDPRPLNGEVQEQYWEEDQNFHFDWRN